MNPSNWLKKKGSGLLITNCCRGKCGGCNQFCPIFKEDEKWIITLEQLKVNIDHLLKFYPNIWLFGGEPLHHPQWDRIVKLLHQYPQRFNVSTNLVPDHKLEFNIYHHSGLRHKRLSKGIFVPTLIAPIDIFGIKDRNWYWRKAQQDCYVWRAENCRPLVYNNKAYFCQLAGAFDQITREDHGWKLNINEDPFDKTKEEIAEQASHFCYRCGACGLNPKTPIQYIDDFTLISKTNLDKIGMTGRKGRLNLINVNKAEKKYKTKREEKKVF